MKKILLSGLLIIALYGCNNKSVQLPINNIKGIQDTIYNNSKIWIFFQEKNNDTIALFNKNNKLVNTHFIFNIDKRLKLKHIIDKLNKIQFKKEQPSMHSNGEYMHSYLSYVDNKTNRLSMVLFDSVKFFPLKELKANKNQLILNYSTSKINLNDKEIVLKNVKQELKKHIDSSNKTLHLILDKNITYNKYLKLKASLQQLEKETLAISCHEYYY